MTAELLDDYPEDVESLVVAWLAPLRDTAIRYRSGDPLPFTLIRHIAGAESVDEGTADLTVQVDTLCDKKLGALGARDECRKTHRRMLELARYLDIFTLPGGRSVAVDYVSVAESPLWLESEDDNILRKVGRYQIGVAYTNSPTP